MSKENKLMTETKDVKESFNETNEETIRKDLKESMEEAGLKNNEENCLNYKKVEEMCTIEYTNKQSDVTKREEFKICDLPNEVIGNFLFNYQNDVDLINVHNSSNVRIKIISEQRIQRTKLLVFGESDVANVPEIISIYYKNSKSGECKEICDVQLRNHGIFGRKINDKIIVGDAINWYTYCHTMDKWNKAQDEDEVQNSRYCARSCSLKENLLLCGGNLGNRVDLLRSRKIG